MPAAFSVPALEQLLHEIDTMAPNRSKASDGWIGDPAHASRHSDHNPEPDGSVDARDFTHDPAHGVDCSLLADQVKDDPRLEGGGYVIWNWQIWNPDIARIWRPYTGTNGHTKHMHVSVSDAGQNDTSPWLTDQGDLSVADIEKLEAKFDRLIEVTINQNKKNRKADLARELREAKRDNRNTDDIEKAIRALDAEDD
jgi:hypothetical protein